MFTGLDRRIALRRRIFDRHFVCFPFIKMVKAPYVKLYTILKTQTGSGEAGAVSDEVCPDHINVRGEVCLTHVNVSCAPLTVFQSMSNFLFPIHIHAESSFTLFSCYVC